MMRIGLEGYEEDEEKDAGWAQAVQETQSATPSATSRSRVVIPASGG
jgi:hypothetical protein